MTDMQSLNSAEKSKAIIINVVKYFTLIVMAIVFTLPLLAIIFAAFKTQNEFYNLSKLALPGSFLNMKNFETAFVEGGILNAFKNTAIILAFSLAGCIVFGAAVGFVMSRFNFIGKKLIMGMFFSAMLIPMVTTQVATYQIMTHLHLVGTIWSCIVLYLGADVMSIFIMMQFVNSLPVSLDESAMLDGASYFTIFFKIIIPNLKPAIATIAIIKGVAIYNDFYTPFLYMPDSSLGTMSTALFRFKGPYGSEWQIICAGVIIVIIPTLIAFLALQKYIYNGFSAGAVKG
jgi:ABC-type glycerol-3-phosphate transport system permease component